MISDPDAHRDHWLAVVRRAHSMQIRNEMESEMLNYRYATITVLGGCKVQISWRDGSAEGEIHIGRNDGRADQRFRAVAIARAIAATGGAVEDWAIL